MTAAHGNGAAADAWRRLLPGAVVRVAAPASLPAAGATLGQALEGAGLDGFLDRAARAGGPLTIVVNDAHRLTDTRTFLDTVLARLERRPAISLRLLVATGSHRSTPEERAAHEARALGPWAPRFAAIRWHDARDDATLARLGDHDLNAWMCEGGHYLACGSMEPHYFAGVTGAHKTLTVGVMSMASLTANHAHALSPLAAGLALADNPVHAGIVRALADLERSGAALLALNQVIVGGATVACTAGAPLRALAAGLPLVRSAFAHAVEDPVDLIVARVAPPLDRDLYQADKAIKNTEAGVVDGGVLVVEAACTHGVGLEQFVDLLRQAPTHASALQVVRARGYRLGDHKAVRLRALTERRGVRGVLVSRTIDPGLASVLGMTIVPDRTTAARWARRHLPARGARALVVEDAGNLTLVARA